MTDNRSGPLDQLRALLPDKLTRRAREDHVQSLISARRGREALFGRHLFSDPAWDVIMELYAARLGERQTPVAELARVIGTPQPVIMRWIAVLVDAGIVCPLGDPSEAERVTVELTEDGAAKMAQLADQWSSAFVAI